jgi:O-succinylbenzoate synthase
MIEKLWRKGKMVDSFHCSSLTFLGHPCRRKSFAICFANRFGFAVVFLQSIHSLSFLSAHGLTVNSAKMYALSLQLPVAFAVLAYSVSPA